MVVGTSLLPIVVDVPCSIVVIVSIGISVVDGLGCGVVDGRPPVLQLH